MASQKRVLVFSPRDKEACKSVVRKLQQENVIAVDCEGVHLGTKGPLTLIQIGTINGDVYLFDVMKDEKEQDKSFFKDTGLEKVLSSPKIVKVIHSCSGDSAALFHQFGIKLENVFDTQVAHLVIAEHKGRRLPYRLKLAELCSTYSDTAKVYEAKDDVKLEWCKIENDYWAKRPLTQEMIDYASGDVTALIPDVFEKQKRYLEENGQIDKYAEMVQEEIEFHIDPAMKEKRNVRHDKVRDAILSDMSAKYRPSQEYSAITDEDEIKALKDINVRDISAQPRVIQNLKHGQIRTFLTELENDLKTPETFISPRNLDQKLHDIENYGQEEIRKDASRLRKQVCEVVTNDIQRKYTPNTPVENISESDIRVLRYIKPISDDGPSYFHPTVLALHWKVEEHDIDVAVENLRVDPEYNVSFVPKLKFLCFNTKVPQSVKGRATRLLQMVESSILTNIPRKYTRDTPLDQLSETEKTVIRDIRTKSNTFHPTIVSLHWRICYDGLCRDLERYKEGKLRLNSGLEKKLVFFLNNRSVPADVKKKAKEFQQYLLKAR
ncbi:hypothetical protein CHS0354_032343 [Potamilus streckersoni]|uniref:3'-5' exonuclease domain-containing protein n=1 Tax=Potamilus streckersoni TaxID=2493646 RepID=A0AAE0TI06_9BIVA|nr:hypothetical protein CHS0354_032343 [Potamilus streckersoni]